ncbi:hypothetical protein NQ314_014878 [Rhamnusium bicolor]|uniref:DDE-1 domain-containing protein n=1 Tax=Rhamnusium bicolor TaxID=1586634 RepID=A0AAV8X0W3_9CUCU|nr:hypothetical protein NQ314_014878 [Rhamnusium bicolor]
MVIKSYLDNKGSQHPKFKYNLPGKQWTENFVKRNKHLLTKRHCQNIKRKRAEKTDEEIEAYFENLKKTIENIQPEFILNYDERNLSDDPGSKKCIFARGTKYPEMDINFIKSAISIMFAVTAVGTLMPLYVVYKSDRIYDQWVIGGPPGTIYNRTKSGWFDGPTFQDWFSKVIIPWARSSPEPKIIIGDNLLSHLNVEVIRACQRYNIKFVFLPPNATYITQPLDVSFFHPLKVTWRKILREIKLKHPKENCVEKAKFPGMLARLLKDIKSNEKTNLRSGFRATGIYPLNPDEVLPDAGFKKEFQAKLIPPFSAS